MKKFITSAILLIAVCSINFAQAPVNNNQESAFGPEIEFEMLKYDFGTISQNGNGTVEFVFTNTGGEPLVLANVRSSCGCTVPQWPRKPIAAGKSDVISVKYDTRRIGAFKKSITVYSNASVSPIRLEISGTVQAAAATN
jgi:hypothetical protein